jgi:hypothetical protein
MLPNFLVIGAMKAGTSSMYRYLRLHPDVFMPDMKEPQFFVAERTWPLGVEWYERLFDQGIGKKAIGEASTGYTKHPAHPGVPERIFSLMPEVRMIYLIRDPIERIRSHYMHNAAAGANPPPINEVVLNDPVFVAHSCYAMQIERYLDVFPRSQILVIKSEDMLHDRRPTLRRVFEFLDIDPDFENPLHGNEFHRSIDKRTPRVFMDGLRGYPMFQSVVARVPTSVKLKLDTRLSLMTKTPKFETISPSVVAELKDRLREDMIRLKGHMEPGFEPWGLA